jgi:two-component system, OmpR family, response regulator QseB
MRILVAEDDELLGDGIKKGLEKQQGYIVDWLKDGATALQAIKSEGYEIVILDLGLPKMDGLSVLKELRSSGIDTPVLILTARDTPEDRVKGLDYGADDYLTKPFDIGELYARIRAIHRRATHRIENKITHGRLILDPSAHSVTMDGLLLNIPRREFALLIKLLENTGSVISREQLTQSLYNWDDEIDSNTLEVHIHNLRKKLGNSLIRTIRGVGYMIDKIDTHV